LEFSGVEPADRPGDTEAARTGGLSRGAREAVRQDGHQLIMIERTPAC